MRRWPTSRALKCLEEMFLFCTGRTQHRTSRRRWFPSTSWRLATGARRTPTARASTTAASFLRSRSFRRSSDTSCDSPAKRWPLHTRNMRVSGRGNETSPFFPRCSRQWYYIFPGRCGLQQTRHFDGYKDLQREIWPDHISI